MRTPAPDFTLVLAFMLRALLHMSFTLPVRIDVTALAGLYLGFDFH